MIGAMPRDISTYRVRMKLNLLCLKAPIRFWLLMSHIFALEKNYLICYNTFKPPNRPSQAKPLIGWPG